MLALLIKIIKKSYYMYKINSLLNILNCQISIFNEVINVLIADIIFKHYIICYLSLK